MKINKHARMKNKMNKTMKYLSMAALALVGAVMTGCSKDDIVDIDQPGSNNVERLTVVANLDGSTTRALTNEGVKTYAVGDKIAVVYKNTSGNTVKAESDALTDGDITGSGKSAKFTVTLVDADKNQNVTYIYPAAMAKENGDVNYDALYNEQDGTLATLGKKFDYCTFTGAWNEGKLPTADLTNQLFVCEFTLKYSGASINDKVTAMTISDNASHNYYVYRTPSNDPIYVAIRPTSDNSINYTAIADGKVYTKSVTGKTYAAGTMRPIILNMDQNNDLLPGLFSVSASKKAYFSKGNLQATYNGSSWTWAFAANQWDYIGDATGNTKVTATYPFISENATVDLFGWVGASSDWTDAAQYGITSSTKTDNTNGYGNNVGEGLKSDWGTLMGDGWRTLTGGSGGEWEWLLGPYSVTPNPGTNCRTSSTVNGTANARFAKATVAGKTGMILFPDSYTHPSGVTAPTSINTRGAAYTANSYDATDWGKMEAAGCVFLPAAGCRSGASVSNSYGYYWSSTPHYTSFAYSMHFSSFSFNPQGENSRYYGFSVRLVRDAQ